MECQGTESVRSLRKGIPNLTLSSSHRATDSILSSTIRASHARKLQTLPRSLLAFFKMREEKGREQALCARRRRTKSGALRPGNLRSFPSLIQGASGSIGCCAANRAGARSWETALPRLFVGGLPVLYHSPPGASLHSF